MTAEGGIDRGHGSRRGWVGSVIGGLIWVAAVGGGFGLLIDYDSQPGARGPCPDRLPDFVVPADSEQALRLLVFAHPRCPCTRASLRELARVAAHCGPRLECDLYFYLPAGADDGWIETDLWETARSIRHLRIHPDPDGALATRCGALTSGHALLFDADGRLRFDGGLTIARGHEGDSPGVEAILNIASQGAVRTAASPVFGCPIQDEQEGAWTCSD